MKDDEDSRTHDLFEGERLKREGMQRAADAKILPLDMWRRLALEITPRGGLCDASMLGKEAAKRNYPPIGMAAGSLFKTDDWAPTDEMVKQERVCAHARDVKRWRRI